LLNTPFVQSIFQPKNARQNVFFFEELAVKMAQGFPFYSLKGSKCHKGASFIPKRKGATTQCCSTPMIF